MYLENKFLSAAFALIFALAVAACSGSSVDTAGTVLQVEEVDPDEVPLNPVGPSGQEIPATGENGLNAIFSGELGVPISRYSMGLIDPDPTGLNPCTDFDGDGIPNDEEVASNEFEADYPRVVTRIAPPITMEIRVSETDSSQNHSETVEAEDMDRTITDSMEKSQYSLARLKTTPVVVKNSTNNIGSRERRDIYTPGTFSRTDKWGSTSCSYSYTVGEDGDQSGGGTDNTTIDSWDTSNMSETTTFPDVNYKDNSDSNGYEYSDDTVKNISKNTRNSAVLNSNIEIGPNAGIVRASLFIKNMSVNIPVKISNIYCTLTFLTPAGEYLPVKTFRLRNEDWSEYSQDVYGGEEFGPFTIEIINLNTNEVKKALSNGYMPQISIISYEMSRVDDSNYNPGVDNLKIVEETAKGRTALLRIIGPGMREMYRVPAFDVDSSGAISPGISLKKALFLLFRDRTSYGEEWNAPDKNDTPRPLTVSDADLKWKVTAPDHEDYTYSSNTAGNSWSMFETYVKQYADDQNQTKRIETIKRIGQLQKYNPFDTSDNPSYSSNELLTEEELFRMRYWIIFHNGRYFNGDINDPIWAGERYEIICMDIGDFNRHFDTFTFTPLQTAEQFALNTVWSEYNNTGMLARARYIGRALKGDVIKFELDVKDIYMLFDPSVFETGAGFGTPYTFTSGDGYGLPEGSNAWYNFNYTFGSGESEPNGIPQEFTYEVEGGTNSITVWLGVSQNAREYDIIFYNNSAPANIKTVRRTNEELAGTNGCVLINRKTVDKDNNLIGALSAGTYTVSVKARGVYYGAPSVTISSTGNTTVSVAAAASGTPGAFSYSVTGLTNQMELRVEPASNAEFYVITYQGPFNYGYNNTPPSAQTVIVQAGYNLIEDINVTYGTNDLTDNEEILADPGVYQVTVYAGNANALDGSGNIILANCRKAAPEEILVGVNYERYADQKQLFSKQSTDLFDQRAIDLEVNFDDGTGWYRLKLASDQRGDDGRTINCLATNYMEYTKQKFHICFRPPQADEYCPYSVFDGGRDEVDVYVRTVARPEYKYAYWMKQGQSYSTFGNPPNPQRYIYVNSALEELPGNDVIKYWMQNDLTDVYHFTDTVNRLASAGGRAYDTLAGLADVDENDFGLKTEGTSRLDDYFFAPAVERNYALSASIQDSLPQDSSASMAKPSFNAVAAETSIAVSSMSYAQSLDNFRVYWREGDYIGENIDDDWSGPTVTSEDNCIISGLEQFAFYTVCVAASSNGVSSALSYKLVRTSPNWVAQALETPPDYSYGAGRFAPAGSMLTAADGVPLTNNVHFAYEKPIDGDQYGLYDGLDYNILDTVTGGPLANNRYLRMIVNNLSINASSGLFTNQIIPLAVDLGSAALNALSCSPAYTIAGGTKRYYIYVDPVNNKFVMPRPCYMRLNASQVLNPVIGSATLTAGTYTNWSGSSYMKFQSELSAYQSTPAGTQEFTTIHRNSWPNKGTISVWLIHFIGGDSINAACYMRIGNNNVIDARITQYSTSTTQGQISVYVNNTLKYTSAAFARYTNKHIYIIWDKDKTDIDGTNTWKVFVDKVLVANGADNITSLLSTYPLWEKGYAYNAHTNCSAISASQAFKYWDEVVSTTPDWIYNYENNGGDAYRYALHPIYGSANGYKPNFGTGNGVGCYYVPGN